MERFVLRKAEEAYGKGGRSFVKKRAPSLLTRNSRLVKESSSFYLGSFAAKYLNRLSPVVQIPFMMEVYNSYSTGKLNASTFITTMLAYKAGKLFELGSEKRLEKRKQLDFDI